MLQLPVFVLGLALCGTAGQIGDAPEVLITDHGIEIRSDGRVFAFFAALNGLGYSTESEHKGPPLSAPVFHPIRTQTREAMRKLESSGRLAGLKEFFEKHPAPIESYLGAILGHDQDLAKDLDVPRTGQALKAAMALLAEIGKDPELAKALDDVSLEQRAFNLDLKGRLDQDFKAAANLLGITDLRTPLDLTVISNPLDAHHAGREVNLREHNYLIVGPSLEHSELAILGAALRPLSRALAERHYSKAAKLRAHWEILKTTSRLGRAYPDGQHYLAETLTNALAFRIQAQARKPHADAEDDFVDEQTRNGFRWTKALLVAMEPWKGGEPIDAAVPKILARINP